MSSRVQPNVSHLDRRQPTEVEIVNADHLAELARAGTPCRRLHLVSVARETIHVHAGIREADLTGENP